MTLTEGQRRMFVNVFDSRSQTDYQDGLTVWLDDVAGSLEASKILGYGIEEIHTGRAVGARDYAPR